MTNQPPSAITIPPDGWEWTGEDVRFPEHGEVFAFWMASGKWVASSPAGHGHGSKEAILRKIKPPELFVKLPRGVVENLGAASGEGDLRILGIACRAALDAADDPSVASASATEGGE